MNKVKLENFGSYNERRYGKPWAAIIIEGKYDFANCDYILVGDNDFQNGTDLYIKNPKVNTIYAYGQKDYRGNNTFKKYKKYTENGFVDCNILGETI